ncbi:phosphoribosyltransferase [Larkinella soli]|uniref:phosphoribosyltransferase n=1 Tax=Larkinella soli TaxID=1770527 RepID=UPI000FFC23F3|nr:phosphoribosyltransferase [Larkinella soli]
MKGTPYFFDRTDAGRQLAERLAAYAGGPEVRVLALPRGGVPVAYEVAVRLAVPLDVFLVRKLGVPGQEELALGAIATGGVRVLNRSVLRSMNIRPDQIEQIAAHEQRELHRRELAYRSGRPPVQITGKTILLIDDGLATGATMRAAVEAVRKSAPAKVVVAVPVGAADVCRDFRRLADAVVCLVTPEPFYGVGMWYKQFGQTTDEEVRALLKQAEAGSENTF